MKNTILYFEARGDLSGGGQISLWNLLNILDRNEFKPVVICPKEGSLVDKLRDSGIDTEIVPLPTLRFINPITFIKTTAAIINIIKKYEVSLIHTNASRPSFYSILPSLILKIPFIWHVRISESDGIYDTLISSFARKLLIVSDAVKQRFASNNVDGKIEVIYNGIDTDKFDPAQQYSDIRGELNIDSKTPLVGVIGNLIDRKGQDIFIRSAKGVLKNIPEAKFLIIGDGELRGDLINLTKDLEISKNVIFTGKRTDIPNMLSSLDVVVQPSICPEACSRVILESMAMAKPLIATAVGGNTELIDSHTGVLIPESDHLSMASSIIQLLKDRDNSKSMGKKARIRAKEKFDIKHNVKKIEQLYKDILG